MKGTKIMWIALAIAVICGSFIAGYSIGAKSGNSPVLGALTGGNFEQGLAAGFEQARKKLAESGMFPPAPTEVKTISGTVKSVDAGKFVIATGRISPNPLDDQGPTERTVVITKDTKIVSLVPVTAEETAAANKKFQEDTKAGKIGTPPAPVKEVAASLDDIKISMSVTVSANEDISKATTINANRVIFSAITNNMPPITVPPGTKAPAPIQ